MSELIEKTLWLVSQPSVTTQEEALCANMLGWAEEKLPGEPLHRFRNGFLVAPRPRAERPTLALVGHLDTVPPAGQQRLGVEDARLYGCGASDMKAGVAVMMQALEERHRFAWNLVGVFYDREEGPYADNGLDPLLDHLPAVEFAIVLEPTNNQIHAGCVGSLQARVHFQGQRAHSARPWQGQNALYQALPFLQRLAQFSRRSVVCQGLEFFEVITATQAQAMGPSNAVPEHFVVNVNSRFAPGRDAEEAVKELEALLQGEGRLEVYDLAPSGAVELSHPSLRRWIEQQRLAVEPKQAWTDVARLGQRGIAAFNFGPGDPAQAHQANEFVLVNSLLDHYHKLTALLDQTQ